MPSAPSSTPTGPALSAVLIVKDEELVLGACLNALRGAVDEVVVYDTGSSDSTREIARGAGAVVVEGRWDQHFGDARNRALAHATGDWVLSVDADEVLTGDPTALRRTCQLAPQGLARLTVVSTTTGGHGDHVTHPVRLFRRGAFTWAGALHERLVPVPGVPEVTAAPTAAGCHLLHSGYEETTSPERDKAARNLSIARAAVEALPASGEDPASAWDAYGRSLAMAGRWEEALDALGRVLPLGPDASVVLQSGRAALSCLRELGHYRGAEPWLTAMAGHGESPAAVAAWKARAALAAGDVGAAELHLAAAGSAPDVDRVGAPALRTGELELLRAEALRCGGRPAQALEVVLDHLRRGDGYVALEQLVVTADAAGAALPEVVRRVPGPVLDRSVSQAVLLPQPLGDRWLRVVADRCPGDLEPLVAGTLVASRSDLETAVHWSSTARGRGLAHLCPLRAIGDDTDRPAPERVLAWSLVAGLAGDDDGRARLAGLLARLTPEELVESVGPAAELVPDVVDVLAAAVDAAVAARSGAVV